MRFALLALVIVGCAPKKVDFSFLPANTISGITIANESAKFGEGGVLIFGDLKNGDHEMKRVFVMYDVLDAEGRKLEETAAESGHLDPGQTWRFRTFTKRTEARKFQVNRILTEWQPD